MHSPRATQFLNFLDLSKVNTIFTHIISPLFATVSTSEIEKSKVSISHSGKIVSVQ
jgi:glycosylphosphatidylinositol transamidase (GPIT) subunit GPI8